jgi:predicted flavoprotein YhiN
MQDDAGTMSFDVVVLGAGAAGMMCAAEAGKRGRRVLLLEHGERVGRKILISGGGRCNFTNIHTRAENFLSENPHFAKSALARYTPKDFVALVEKHGIHTTRRRWGSCSATAPRSRSSPCWSASAPRRRWRRGVG